MISKTTRKHHLEKRARMTWPEYQASIRAECVRRINASREILAGLGCEQWTEIETKKLRHLTDRSIDEAYGFKPDPKTDELYERLRAVLIDVHAFVKQRGERGGGMNFSVLGKIAEATTPLMTQIVPGRVPYAENRRERLAVLMHEYFRRNIGRAPTMPELALLSLVAGNFPDGQAKLRHAGTEPTAAAVIGAERKAMGQVRERYSKVVSKTVVVAQVEDLGGGRLGRLMLPDLGH